MVTRRVVQIPGTAVASGLIVLGGVAALIALTWVVAGGPVDYVSTSPPTAGRSLDVPQPTAVVTYFGVQGGDVGDAGLPGWLIVLIQLLLMGVASFLLYLIVLLVRAGWRLLLGLRVHETALPPPGTSVPLPDVPEQLTGAAAEERRAKLIHGETRNAVVACWVDLEAAAAESGLPRQRAETPTEYVSRVLATWDIDDRALDDLAALYREARFSTHQITESHRERAVTDLDRLHADLAAAAPPPPSGREEGPG